MPVIAGSLVSPHSAAARSVPNSATRSLPASASGDTHRSDDDVATSEEETLVPGTVFPKLPTTRAAPQQVLTWRRQARRLPRQMADDPPFVPAGGGRQGIGRGV